AHLAALADRFRRRIEVRDERIANRIVKVLHTYPFAGAVRAPRRALAELDRGLDLELGLRVMGRAIHADRHGPWLTRRVIHAVHDAMQDGGAVDLPRGLRVHVAGKHAWLTWRTQPELGIPVPRVDVVDLADASFSRSARRAVLDADVLGAAPTLRLLKSNDTFVPFGSTSGCARNVVRWLSKQGVPAFARRGVLVLEGDAGVAWVVGERIDARHAITPRSRCAARVRLPDD
nr:hypothetical protein [Planctomycetota bacterium]